MYLFVYGTLRREAGRPMRRWLELAEFVSEGRFQGRLYNVGSYPAAVASEDSADAVLGEVYLLREPAAILAVIDQYEGCSANDAMPHEYRRAVADIQLEARVVPAQIYLYQWSLDGLTRIVAGDYLVWLARQTSALAAVPEKRMPPAGSTGASC